MDIRTKLPVGIDNFEKIRTMGFYYVDKTGMIKDLLDSWGEVNLFTRPRRFGKSLNMSMLKYFFEYGCDSRLFDGLEIAGEQGLCEKYMGKFPVISITLYPDSSDLDRGCLEALEQIGRMGYVDKLRQDGLATIYKYGIACHRKRCRVQLQGSSLFPLQPE